MTNTQEIQVLDLLLFAANDSFIPRHFFPFFAVDHILPSDTWPPRFLLSSGTHRNAYLPIVTVTFRACPSHVNLRSWTDSSIFPWQVCSRMLSLRTVSLCGIFNMCSLQMSAVFYVGQRRCREGVLLQQKYVKQLIASANFLSCLFPVLDARFVLVARAVAISLFPVNIGGVKCQ